MISSPCSSFAVHGDWTRNAAWKYVSGEVVLRSISMPVHGLTVTPVESLPHESVMVFVRCGSSIAL